MELPHASASPSPQLGDEEQGIALAKKQQKWALAFFGRDITELARRGKLEPVIGRKDEILRVARILSQKRKANPVLVGEPGVGKTGIVEGLAQRIASSECPEFLLGARIVEISLAALILERSIAASSRRDCRRSSRRLSNSRK
jgi:ATP-dependent Clp protease ATP-binding subunit ClpA